MQRYKQYEHLSISINGSISCSGPYLLYPAQSLV
jgi:hypothetical protein